MMKRTFGEHLLQFALSVDIVDPATAEGVLRRVEDYAKGFGVGFLEFLVLSDVDGQPGLKTHWAWGGADCAVSIRGADGKPIGHSGYAFIEKKPLWIVDVTKKPFSAKSQFQDLWSQSVSSEIPAYLRCNDHKIKTSILIPVRDNNQTYGVLNLETENYLEPTEIARRELTLVAESLSIIYRLSRSHGLQARSTQEALRQLDEFRRTSPASLAKPQVFIATADRADDHVVGLIREVVAEFKDQIVESFWRDSSESGDINQQILTEIAGCTFGICYFSVVDDGTHRYGDNVNVVFEAGMLHSLTNGASGEPYRWIPVREKDSPPTPFDFAAQRLLIVDRLSNASVNAEKFKHRLRDRLKNVLRTDARGARG